MPLQPFFMNDGVLLARDESHQTFAPKDHLVAMHFGLDGELTSVLSTEVDDNHLGQPKLSVAGSRDRIAFMESAEDLGGGAWSNLRLAQFAETENDRTLTNSEIDRRIPSRALDGSISAKNPPEFLTSSTPINGVQVNLVALSKSGKFAFLEGPSETWICRLVQDVPVSDN